MKDQPWLTIDAQGKTFGRLASSVANELIGKKDPHYQPHVLPKNHVVVINCDQIKISPRRATAPYYRHSGYLGHLKTEVFVDRPLDERLKAAVVGMLPKNKVGRHSAAYLHCYKGAEQPHKGQTQ